VDHIIPLALGGSNRDENLWCQHKSLAVTPLETALFEKLNKGEITQKEAIEQILEAKFKEE
jgi:5-methylcytosine-specific restriction endonuclease McrA